MAAAEIEALKRMRNALVLARLKLVAKANELGQVQDVAEFIAATEQLSKLQTGIEAVDRAIKDEGGLAPGSAALPSGTRG